MTLTMSSCLKERNFTMQKTHSALPKLPGIAFVVLPTTGETIAIRQGESTYYRVDTTKTAEELNALYGVTKAEAQAMLASLMSGWGTTRSGPERENSPRA
jgi:hypothetical protein